MVRQFGSAFVSREPGARQKVSQAVFGFRLLPDLNRR
jgi:hypothetical protein